MVYGVEPNNKGKKDVRMRKTTLNGITASEKLIFNSFLIRIENPNIIR